MTEEAVHFLSPAYNAMLALLLGARGLDLFSTRVATPTLTLEGNPFAKWLGWRRGVALNVAIAILFAFWPMIAIIVSTTAVLVAARNFHGAWLMRTMGEEAYRDWYIDQLTRAHRPLYLGCLLAETAMFVLVGAALVIFSRATTVAFSIGVGVIGYAGAVLFYTLLSLWRLRRHL